MVYFMAKQLSGEGEDSYSSPSLNRGCCSRGGMYLRRRGLDGQRSGRSRNMAARSASFVTPLMKESQGGNQAVRLPFRRNLSSFPV
jgi:hypothetical protein